MAVVGWINWNNYLGFRTVGQQNFAHQHAAAGLGALMLPHIRRCGSVAAQPELPRKKF